MPLLEFWSSNPNAVGQLSIAQVVMNAGDGVLKDSSACSRELREYFSQVPTNKLGTYVEQCLSSSFDKGGMALQDLINELGRRLDYEVENGRYQGNVSAIGFDGVWISPEDHAIVAEVKTTDAYRISLDTLATYRKRLTEIGRIKHGSSILIVVGRQDTGELEAQVRGSRHAWDIRLISAEALLKLVRLKQTAEGPETGRKIRSLLIPAEYTKLDGMIDVMFTAAKDVEEGAVEVAEAEQSQQIETSDRAPASDKIGWQFTDSTSLQRKRDQLVTAIARQHGTTLSKESRALYGDSYKKIRLAATISKRYQRRTYPYWYAYHPNWDTFLANAETALLVLGCMDLDYAFAIPRKTGAAVLDSLNISVRPDGERYWHLHLVEAGNSYNLLLPKKAGSLQLTEYVVAL